MKLEEIFNYHGEITWQTSSGCQLTSFDLNDGKFQLQIIPKMIPAIPEFKGYSSAEISFARRDIPEVDKAFSTQKTKIAPFKVYGAVANGLAKKFNEYDVFFYEILRKHSNTDGEFNSKINIYNAMMDRIKKDTSIKTWYYERNGSSGKIAIISKVKLSDETTMATGFINPLKEAMIELNMHTNCAWFDDL